MKQTEELLLYRSIVDKDLELFDRIIESHDLKYLNSVRFGKVFDIMLPIELAVESGNLPVVIRILEMGEDPSKGMGEAVCQEDPDIVKVLLDAGAKIENSHELLSRAARSGNLEIIKLLIEGGAEIHNYDLDNDFFIHPLVISISNGHIQIYEYLQKFAGQSAEALDIVGLQEVAKEGDLKTMQFLLDRGIDVNSTHCLLWGSTALIAAVGANQWCVVEYLIDRGADINAQDFWGRTALMRAVSHGSLTLTKKLLAAGANRGLSDSQGNTARDLAIERQDRLLVRLLQ